MLPYSKQSIDQRDIDAVVEVLKSDWLTTGPMVSRFEEAVGNYVSAPHAVAFSNGTAALHATIATSNIQPGDEVIVPAITFVATANAVVYCGGTPIFADVDPDTLLINPQDVVRKITSRTRAILAMDYAGQTCDYPKLKQIADQNDLTLLSDGCHSIGAMSYGRHVPEWVEAACYSFHPVKPMTTCEGGMVVTGDAGRAESLRRFRNHGINSDHHQRARNGTCYYDMESLGFNYRLSDVQCALGLAQLQRLREWTERRSRIAQAYHRQLRDLNFLKPLKNVPGAGHAHHLFVVRWHAENAGVDRDSAIQKLREAGVFANVHYRPVYQHSFYQKRKKQSRLVSCPKADAVYPQLISLPIFPAMQENDVAKVVTELKRIADPARSHRWNKAA